MRLACEECHHATDDAYGWIATVVDEDEELDLELCLVFYCPTCAEREFNYVSHRRAENEFE